MGYYTSRLMAGLSTGDADATAFLTAAGITDATITSAINKLVTDLKGFGLWGKMKAIYPFVGGTASTHKWNLKDPRDLDAAFRLVFNGIITHNLSGITGNGSSGYYETYFNDNNSSLNDHAIGVYVTTNINDTISTAIDFGIEYTGVSDTHIYTRGADNFYSRCHCSNVSNVVNTDSRGFYILSRINSSNYAAYKNTTKYTYSIASTATRNATYKGMKNGTFYSTRRQSLAFISSGLTDTNQSNLYTAVQAFQTTLGRQV